MGTRKDGSHAIPSKSLPWFCERIRDYEVVHVPDVASLPKEASAEKAAFSSRGIRSLVAVPIISADAVMGFIGFESLRGNKQWSENTIALLKIIGEIFAFALSSSFPGPTAPRPLLFLGPGAKPPGDLWGFA